MPNAKITLAAFLAVVFGAALYSWLAPIEAIGSFGNTLLVAGVAVAAFGLMALGVSTTRRDADLRFLLFEGRPHERLKKRSERNVMPFVSVVLGSALAAGLGYLIVLIR